MRILHAIHALFAKRLRLSNPWNYKAPVLMSVTYLAMSWLGFQLLEALQTFAWSLCAILGIAGFGYLSNDLGDRAADQKAGKANLVAKLSPIHIMVLLALFLALALLPWILYFPMNAFTVALLGAEFLLFVLYVLPPFRLKERGLLGVVTDALYAHALPAILALATLTLLAGKPLREGTLLFLGLGLWQVFLGMRNILLHQLKDAENDRKAGLHTWVTRRGEASVVAGLGKIIVPLELLAWLLLLGILVPLTWLPLVAWPVYLAWQFPRQKECLDLRGWLYRYLDDFYIPYFPLVALLGLCIQDWRMMALALAHILLFKNAISPARDRFLAIFFKPS